VIRSEQKSECRSSSRPFVAIGDGDLKGYHKLVFLADCHREVVAMCPHRHLTQDGARACLRTMSCHEISELARRGELRVPTYDGEVLDHSHEAILR
jgi:hypothetical protein